MLKERRLSRIFNLLTIKVIVTSRVDQVQAQGKTLIKTNKMILN